MGNQYYKKKALEHLEGNWGREVMYLAAYFAIAVVGEIFISDSKIMVNIIYSLLTTIVSLGYTKHVLDVINGKQNSQVKDIFVYFTNTEIIGIIGLNILVGIFTILWSMLLIIPGIIFGLYYSQSIYLKMENPDMTAMECIKYSKNLMEGYKMELFILQLSFIGWYILGIATVVGIIPVIVYVNYSMVEFYKNLPNGIEKEVLYEGP